MSLGDLLRLAELLLKWRSTFGVSHHQRDLIDEIVLNVLLKISLEAPMFDKNDIPF